MAAALTLLAPTVSLAHDIVAVDAHVPQPGHPPALLDGYAARIGGQPLSANPYGQGLPCDHEQLAELWDDGWLTANRQLH